MIHSSGRRAPRGTRKVLEWQRVAVLAILIVVVLLAVLFIWLSNMSTKVTGDAQEVYYAGLEYFTRASTTGEKLVFIGQDPDTSLLADNRPVIELVKKQVNGDFFIQADCETRVLNYVTCKRVVQLPLQYAVEFTGVFPKTNDAPFGYRIYKQAPEAEQESDIA